MSEPKYIYPTEVILGLAEAARIANCERVSLEKWESIGLIKRVGSDLYGKPMFLMSDLMAFRKVRPRKGRPRAEIQLPKGDSTWTA